MEDISAKMLYLHQNLLIFNLNFFSRARILCDMKGQSYSNAVLLIW